MEQGGFDFSARLVDPQREPVGSAQTRRAGLQAASLTRDTIWRQMLKLYAQQPYTDAELAVCLGVERSTVNARRAELVALGKVTDMGVTRKNANTGVVNTVWGLVAC